MDTFSSNAYADGIANIAPESSIAFGEDVHRIVGDVELAVIALDKALEIVVGLPGRYSLVGSVPAIVTEKCELLRQLRHDYAHIEERALGKIKGTKTQAAERVWQYQSIFVDRKLTDGNASLGIDQEATNLCTGARAYLVRAWSQLTARARANAQDAASA